MCRVGMVKLRAYIGFFSPLRGERRTPGKCKQPRNQKIHENINLVANWSRLLRRKPENNEPSSSNADVIHYMFRKRTSGESKVN